ncbi:hypothetical protein [Mesorhizobium sp. B2-3-2]|uniref:hypothetical protein n=1 Tax=Mesorhizobium sp. B2-3-2 TaxID=2589961 RepID=UPI001129B041|nr:hypothetical protein [Mesorhizobium sp. B2-3-2]TPM37054.1 hypothetical protein FJ964_30435 [Mesorhizobium sp. B2-3-2]
MTTLNIGGKRVTVSDDFMSMSPEQQQATVEEIAGQIQPEQSSGLGDVTKSAISGVRQGVESIVGMAGDVGKYQGQLAGWLAGKLGASPETQDTVRAVASKITPFPTSPTTERVQEETRNLAGDPYQPQTTAGEYARTIGQFAPGVVAGPGGAISKTAMAVIPAVASETAGQITKGTPYEKYARAAAALVAGAPVAFFGQAGGNAATIAKAVEGSTPQQINEAERLFMDAQAAGTPITRFEAIQQVTGSGTRAGDVQRVVEGQGGLRDFMAGRPQQIEQTARGQMDAVAPVNAAPSTVGPAVGQTAEGVVSDVRQGINRVTEPLYTQAAPQRIDPQTFQRVQAAPGWAEARAAVRGDPQLQRYVQGLPDDSVGFLNEVQKYLRQQADNAGAPVNAQQNMQRSAGYGADAAAVRSAAEAQSPEFAQAIQQQAQLRQQYLDPLLQGPLGKIASRDTTTQQAIEALFPRNPLPNSTQEIGRAVGVLARRNPDAARQLVRAHIESTFNQATKELQSGANQFGGAGFVAALRGNPQQSQNLEAAVRALPGGDDVWTGFNRYLDILQAQGTRQRIGSQTAFNQELLKDLKQGSPLGTASAVAIGGGLSWPKKALDTVEGWRLGRNVDQIARLITDPAAGRAFRQLARAGGHRARDIAVSLSMMGASGRASSPNSQPAQ